MNFIAKLAFKNIFRNHRRTVLTAFGIMVAVASTIFGKSFIDGEFVPIIQNIADMQTGHVRIVNVDYTKKERLMPIYLNIDYEKIEKKISSLKNLELMRPRIKFGTLISKGEDEIDGMQCVALVPEREKNNSMIKNSNLKRGEVLLSKSFAEKHKIAKGDTVVLITQTVYGYINGMSLVANEFYETGIEYLASSILYMHLEDAQSLLAMSRSSATELLIYANDINKSKRMYYEIKSALKGENYEIKHYESEGTLLSVIKSAAGIMFLVAVIIFFLASIAIVNTMIMSLHERMKEVGMMKALGLPYISVFNVFLLETVIIGLLGSVLGVILGAGVTAIFAKTGIDYSQALKSVEMPVNPIIYPVMSFQNLLMGFLMGVFSSLLSSLFLYKRIKKINPAEILRE